VAVDIHRARMGMKTPACLVSRFVNFNSIGWSYPGQGIRQRRLRYYCWVRTAGDLDDAIKRLCVLDDPARRSCYLAVRTAGHPLTRAEVAQEAGISVRLAAFHLEKLLSEGFLEAGYERDQAPTGVGHPAKRYRPTDVELEVSIPPRRYDLAADILAEALVAVASEGRADPLQKVAANYGRQIGRRTRRRNSETRLVTALRLFGYDPASANDRIVLRNCPFRHAAQARPDVLCRMNHALVAGMIQGVQAGSFDAVLDRAPGRCCVLVTPSTL
jgi:predicted ArsR family transcriptional regulator